MKTFRFSATTASSAALLASLSYGAHAQSTQADPADPRMPVPALSYQSVFKNYQPPSEETPSPAKNWRATNEDIAKNGGMAMAGGMSMQMKGMQHGDMKGMQEGEMKGMQKDKAKGTTSMPMNEPGKGVQTMKPMPNDSSQKR